MATRRKSSSQHQMLPLLRKSSSTASARAEGKEEGGGQSTRPALLAKRSGSSHEAADAKEDAATTEIRSTQQQLAQCRAEFLRRVQASLEEATALGTRADALEQHHRAQNERRAERRHKMLEAEEALAAGRQAAIAEGWATLLEGASSAASSPSGAGGIAGLEDLAEELRAQRRACEEVLRGKAAVVEGLTRELAEEDGAYVRAVAQHGRDVEALLDKMRGDAAALQQHYERELGAMEAAFTAERQGLLQQNQAEMAGLLERKRERELAYMRAKQAREERFQREIDALVVQEGEAYHQLKIQLELEVQGKDGQVEALKAARLLGQERGAHDARRRGEREAEAAADLAAQKKRLARLKDVVDALVGRCQEHDGRERKRHGELRQECDRLRQQYRDLQRRFRHFERADRERYDKTWAAREEEAKAAADKVLAIDEIIFTRLLDREWAPSPGIEALLLSSSSSSSLSTHGDAAAAPAADGAGEEEGGSAEKDTALVMEEILAGKMLKLIAQEAGFLLLADPTAAPTPAPSCSADEAGNRGHSSSSNEEGEEEEDDDDMETSQSQRGRLLRALGLREEEGELRLLLTYFLRREDEGDEEEEADEDEKGETADSGDAVNVQQPPPPPERTATTTNGGGGGGGDDEPEASIIRKLAPLRRFSCPEASYAMIGPDAVVDALRRFLADRARQQQQRHMRHHTHHHRRHRRCQLRDSSNGKQQQVNAKAEDDDHEAPSLGLGLWRRLAGGALPEAHLATWAALERALLQYHKLLDDRGRCLEAVVELEAESDHLRGLLRRRAADPVNAQLLCPPFPSSAPRPTAGAPTAAGGGSGGSSSSSSITPPLGGNKAKVGEVSVVSRVAAPRLMTMASLPASMATGAQQRRAVGGSNNNSSKGK